MPDVATGAERDQVMDILCEPNFVIERRPPFGWRLSGAASQRCAGRLRQLRFSRRGLVLGAVHATPARPFDLPLNTPRSCQATPEQWPFLQLCGPAGARRIERKVSVSSQVRPRI